MTIGMLRQTIIRLSEGTYVTLLTAPINEVTFMAFILSEFSEFCSRIHWPETNCP